MKSPKEDNVALGKARLLAAAYGIDPDGGVVEGDDNEDVVAVLIRSIINDVAGE